MQDDTSTNGIHKQIGRFAIKCAVLLFLHGLDLLATAKISQDFFAESKT